MLNLTTNLLEIWHINISCAAIKAPIIRTAVLAEVIAKAIADAVIVGGIVFFSTLASIGYTHLDENLYTSLIASTVASGLSFFTELRKNNYKIWKKQHIT